MLLHSWLLIVLCAVAVHCIYVVPSVTVDLSLPPHQRWANALETILDLHSFEYSFGPVFSFYNQTLFGKVPKSVFSTCADAVATYFPEYAQELVGLAAAFASHGHPEVTADYLAAWIYMHELGHAGTCFVISVLAITCEALLSDQQPKACTGILVADKHGNVIHGRNLDQEPLAIRNITLHMTFVRGSQVLFEAVDWYWFNLGFMTGYVVGEITLQENWRMVDVALTTILQSIASGTMPQVWAFRHVLTNMAAAPFADVVEYLNTMPVAAPVYYILSGKGKMEGAVVTRDTVKQFDPLYIGSDGSWYLIQCNSDSWLPDPKGDPRRGIAQGLLHSMGQDQGASSVSVLAVLTTNPIGNSDTAVTGVFHPTAKSAHVYGQLMEVHARLLK